MASGSSQVVRSWLGYTESAGGLFTSGNSVASVNALVIAREAAGYPKRATIYMSDETHSSIGRAAMDQNAFGRFPVINSSVSI